MKSPIGRLAGRKILITGAASGIGLATAQLFMSEGAAVAMLDLNSSTVAEADRLGAVAVCADLTHEDEVSSAVAAASEALRGLDGLVNCAGVSISQPFEASDLQAWRRTIDVNLTGAFLVTRAALSHLKRNVTATIVNVASGIGLRPEPGHGAYAASKAGLIAWTKVLAQELGPAIRVNAACPGPTDTPMLRELLGDVAIQKIGVGRALGRAGQPIEQAQAILYLTSSESSFVTGVALPVDGGRVY